MSTAVQTLREPKAERLRSKPMPQNFIEEEESETLQEWYRRWCRECDERREQRILAGELDGDEEITMEEIVAICKEARAERYAEEQEQKKAAHR
jgi:hypothetical protein